MGDIKADGGTENSDVFKQEKGNDSLPNGNVDEVLIKEEKESSEEKEAESSKEENESSKKDHQPVESGESEDSEKVEPTEYIKRLRSRSSRTTRSSRSSSIELKNKDTLREFKSDEGGVTSNLGNTTDEEDFLGFDFPNTTRRDAFLKLIRKRNDFPEKDPTNQESMLETINDENPPSVESDSVSGDTVTKRPLLTKSSKKLASAIISDPKYKKPFEYGWMRELVYRSSGESGLKRSADVYYFTPTGKKLRSVKEVLSCLTEDLSAENFTFLKEPLGVGDKEIVREAKPKGVTKSAEDGVVRKKSTPRVAKATATPKQAKGTSQAETSSKASLTPRVVFKSSAAAPKNKSPVSTKPKLDNKKKKLETDDAELPDSGDSEWNNSEPKANPTRDVCSIECRLAMGLIPTLQCHLCLCLYHPECVGLQEDKIKPARAYVCKNCQVLKKQMSPQFQQPSTSQTSSKVPSPPKKDVKIISVPRTQSIVGALTTWLPHSSSIQVSSGNNNNNNNNGGNTVSTNTCSAAGSKTYSTGAVTTIAPSTNSGLTVTNNTTIDAVPQSLLTLNGRAYVFVPKHNVVNVSNQSGGGGGSSTMTQPSSGSAAAVAAGGGGHSSSSSSSSTAIVGGTADHYNPTGGLTNLVATAPGTFVISTQSAPPANPHGLFLVPFPLQQSSTEPVHPQATIVNHSIQAVTPYTPGSQSLSNAQ